MFIRIQALIGVFFLSMLGMTRLITQQQAAKFAGVTDRTIRNWISEGHLTGYRLPTGRAVRVDQDELQRIMRVIPTVRRATQQPFGPKATIRDLRNVVSPVVVHDDEDDQ
jgi:excisionase family DNA binding protein